MRTNDSDMHERIESTRQMFLTACHERGFLVTADERVSEPDAAALLAFTPESLRNRRYLGTGPASYQRPVGAHKVSYRVRDLAAWIEQYREEAL